MFWGRRDLGARQELGARHFLQVYASFRFLRVCKLFYSKGIRIVVGRLTNLECLSPDAIKYKFYYFFFLSSFKCLIF
jgi:hypothetical protein